VTNTGSNVTPLTRPGTAPGQVAFDRIELNAILNVYGRMVAAGLWRDYAIDLGRDAAIFSAFRRASERPEIQLVKRPDLRAKQGLYALIGEAGAVLRRGGELSSVLAPIERKLVKLVDQA
jgi:hypothetical protein